MTPSPPNKVDCDEKDLDTRHQRFTRGKGGRENRGESRGRVQGVHTTPAPEMTCGFLKQLVFCKKKRTMWFIGVEVEQETSAPPPKKEFLTRVVDVIADIFYSLQQLVPRQYKLILE